MMPTLARQALRAAATGLLMAALALPLAAQAGPGHDHSHDDAPPAASGNGPKRQPDGSVFLPKAAQRLWKLRTLPVAAGQHPQTLELDGTVVMDPNAGGKVQAAQAGRLQAGPNGLPSVGQAVRKGEVLAWVVPTAGAIERSNQVAQQAELRAAHALAAKRVARLKELADTVPRKDIEAAESELHSLAQRLAAVGAGLSGREALVAPVSGVIASAHAVAGQVLDARELVFEVVDPCASRRWPTTPPRRRACKAPPWPWASNACPCAWWARRAACAGRRCRWCLRARGGRCRPWRWASRCACGRTAARAWRACRCPRRRCSAMLPTRASSGSNRRPSSLCRAW